MKRNRKYENKKLFNSFIEMSFRASLRKQKLMIKELKETFENTTHVKIDQMTNILIVSFIVLVVHYHRNG